LSAIKEPSKSRSIKFNEPGRLGNESRTESMATMVGRLDGREAIRRFSSGDYIITLCYDRPIERLNSLDIQLTGR
jgi:hypothetical protein